MDGKSANNSVQSLLGIKADDNIELAERIKSGLSFKTFERLTKTTGLSPEALREAIRISPRTMTRRRTENRLSLEESDRLVTVSRVLVMAINLFEGDIAGAVKWLTTPNRALGGETPIATAATETGSREVENIIGRLEYGVFA